MGATIIAAGTVTGRLPEVGRRDPIDSRSRMYPCRRGWSGCRGRHCDCGCDDCDALALLPGAAVAQEEEKRPGLSRFLNTSLPPPPRRGACRAGFAWNRHRLNRESLPDADILRHIVQDLCLIILAFSLDKSHPLKIVFYIVGMMDRHQASRGSRARILWY